MAERAVRRLAASHHLLTYLALVVLATASLLLALLWRSPGWVLVVGLAIAVAKMLLVLWFFMHLAEQPFRTGLVTAVALLFVAILITLTVTDVVTRDSMQPRPLPPLEEAFYRR